MTTRATGAGKIGYTCAYTPLEVLDAFGLTPLRAFGSPSAPNISDAYVHNNFCGYVKNIINANQGQDMIFVDTCCQMKRTHDAWTNSFEGSLSYLLNLPRIDTAESHQFWVDSMKDMIAHLEEALGVRLDSQRLRESIRRRNALRVGLRKAEELLLQNKIFSHRYLELIHQVQGERAEEALNRVKSFLEEQANGKGPDHPVPLLVTGSIIAALPLAKTVEETGGNVVYFDTCCTSRWYQQKEIDEETEPLQALAVGYLGQTPCPRMKQSYERFDQLRQIIRNRQVKGVIHHTLKFCDPFIYESHPFKLCLDEEGVPLLRIESDYDFSVSGQISTRIHAFMEML